MSTTEVTVTSPTDPQSITSPLMEAVDSAVHQGERAIRPQRQPRKWRLVAVRDCPTPSQVQEFETPEPTVDYWRLHMQTNPYFILEVEFFVVLMLNMRPRIKGQTIVGMGTLDSVLVHPWETFRVAIVASAHALRGLQGPEKLNDESSPIGKRTGSEERVGVVVAILSASSLIKRTPIYEK